MEWLLGHGLDGIVGGVVGGLTTALAVWLTLRHDRRLQADARAESVLAEAKRAVGNLHASAWVASKRLRMPERARDDHEREIDDLSGSVELAEPSMWGSATNLLEEIRNVVRPLQVASMFAFRDDAQFA